MNDLETIDITPEEEQAETVLNNLQIHQIMRILDKRFSAEDILDCLYFPEIRQYVSDQTCEPC